MQCERMVADLLMAKPGMLLGVVVSAGFTFALAFSTPASAADGNGPDVSAETAKRAMNITARANVFRLEASSNVTTAVKKWGDRSFRSKWDKEVGPLFGDAEEMELCDFFSAAVLWTGGMTGREAIVGFYNPWVDGLLIVHIDASGKGGVLKDFCFIAGESWRGEDLDNPEDALALYKAEKPLPAALAELYSVSDTLFRKRFPAEGKTVVKTAEVKKIAGSTAEELIPVKARMMYRLKMYRNYLAEENRAAMITAGALMKKLKTGDTEDLIEFLSEKQEKQLVETVVLLPEYVRAKLGPIYFGTSGDFAVVALLNPGAPRWMIIAKMKGEKRDLDVTIETFDLHTGDEFLKQRKEAGQ